jgi:apolipoprotein D and lipocalin family protein
MQLIQSSKQRYANPGKIPFTILLLVAIFIMGLTGCSTASMKPIRTETDVNLTRFMGDWYVIACIPTFIETEATNAVESYELTDPRTVATTFRFNKGSFDGPLKVYRPTGFVREDPSNAVWGMQFIWPIKAEYRIVYVDADYQFTIIGRSKRDYVWIMAREPIISEEDYRALIEIVETEGYDLTQIRRIPQQALSERGQG